MSPINKCLYLTLGMASLPPLAEAGFLSLWKMRREPCQMPSVYLGGCEGGCKRCFLLLLLLLWQCEAMKRGDVQVHVCGANRLRCPAFVQLLGCCDSVSPVSTQLRLRFALSWCPLCVLTNCHTLAFLCSVKPHIACSWHPLARELERLLEGVCMHVSGLQEAGEGGDGRTATPWRSDSTAATKLLLGPAGLPSSSFCLRACVRARCQQGGVEVGG